MLIIRERWKLKDQDRLIEVMSRAEQVAPPENFAESVLVQLEKEQSASRLKKILLEPHYVSLEMGAILSGNPLQQGQVYLIALTGLFYLITGVVLAVGQRWMPYVYLNEWVENQAFIAFLSTAFFLLIWGNLKREKMDASFLRTGSIVYIAVLVVNFVITSRIFTLPLSIILSLFLTGLGLLTACLLIFSSVMRKASECPDFQGN